MKGPIDPQPKAAPTIVNENTFQGLRIITRRSKTTHNEPMAKNSNSKANGN